MTTSLPHLLTRLWRHAARRRRAQFVVLVALMLVSGLAEIVSLGAVFPFLGALVSPERVFSQPWIARIAPAIGVTSPSGLALPLTIVFAVVALAAGAIRLFVLWASTRFSFAFGVDLSIDMYRRTLYQPYRVHVGRNSSEVITGITTKTSTVIVGVILPLLMFASAVIVLVAIALMSLAIDSAVALWSGIGFGASYVLVTLFSRRRLRENGELIARGQTALFKTLQEGLGGIRDVLLDGTQDVYAEIYHRADRSLRTAQAGNTYISASPRFAMEALGMTLMAFIAYGTVARTGEIGVALPVLGALALGAQRLIPSFQQAYSSWATIAGNAPSLVDTLELLDQPLPADAAEPPAEPLDVTREIRFDNVTFRYSPDGPVVLDSASFTIPKGARVGLVGETGSGKSTAADLLMGLLTPDAGAVRVDGEPIEGRRRRAWQRTIAHVPQSVFLSDATLAENIAFGVPVKDIDLARVRSAARQAQIADFIESSPLGYQAVVGERGVRISGGQRQRIGIARALYKRATVLVFDEATSALDSVTERAVMEAIAGLGADLTIVTIAHRLSTIISCDSIVELRDGRVVAQGTYQQLLERSRSFGAMVGQSAQTGVL